MKDVGVYSLGHMKLYIKGRKCKKTNITNKKVWINIP